MLWISQSGFCISPIVVIALPADTQYSTHHVDWPGLLMLGDKQIFHFVSLAKKTVVGSTHQRNTFAYNLLWSLKFQYFSWTLI
jgi:hypothetical protein